MQVLMTTSTCISVSSDCPPEPRCLTLSYRLLRAHLSKDEIQS